MILTADYHTHTTYSHGKGQVIDNARAAKEKGLKEIAITDHGFSHPAFGLRKRKLPSLVADCKKASEETGVKVKVGIESNFTSMHGNVDLKKKYYESFDMLLCGFHKFVMTTPAFAFGFFVPSMWNSLLLKRKIEDVPKSVIKRDTEVYLNVIKNNPVDIITHINFGCYADIVEVAKCAADYGTYIELNAKKVHLTDEEIYKMLKTDVKFVIDSDAHTPSRVGEVSLVENILKRVDIPEDRIANINGKIPEFRFAEFKERL